MIKESELAALYPRLDLENSPWAGHEGERFSASAIEGLSPRAIRLLENVGIRTYGDFFRMDCRGLMRVRKIGCKTCADVGRMRSRIFELGPGALLDAPERAEIDRVLSGWKWRDDLGSPLVLSRIVPEDSVLHHLLSGTLNVRTVGDFLRVTERELAFAARFSGVKQLRPVVEARKAILAKGPERWMPGWRGAEDGSGCDRPRRAPRPLWVGEEDLRSLEEFSAAHGMDCAAMFHLILPLGMEALRGLHGTREGCGLPARPDVSAPTGAS